MAQKAQIEIDTTQVPEHIQLDLAGIIYNATVEFFKQPGVEEAYQKWLAEKRAKEEAAGA